MKVEKKLALFSLMKRQNILFKKRKKLNLRGKYDPELDREIKENEKRISFLRKEIGLSS